MSGELFDDDSDSPSFAELDGVEDDDESIVSVGDGLQDDGASCDPQDWTYLDHKTLADKLEVRICDVDIKLMHEFNLSTSNKQNTNTTKQTPGENR